LAVITVGVWVTGALLGGRTRNGRWLWLGGLLLAGSIAVLAVSLFMLVFGAALLPQTWMADLAAEARLAARGLLQAMVQQLGLRSLIAGGVWFIAAWGLIGLGALQKPRPAAPLQYRS
jgi:hypothetical protein